MNPQKTQRPLARLFAYTRPHRADMYLATLYTVLNSFFDLFPPILIGMAIDVLVGGEQSFLARFGLEGQEAQLIAIAVLAIIIHVFESLFQYLYEVKWRNLAQVVEHDARMEAYAHVQQQDMAYFEDRSTGGLLSILNDDVNQLERFLDIGAREIIHLIVSIAFICTYFFIIAPQVAWLSLLPIPVIIWGSIRFQKLLAPRYAAVREEVGLLNGQLSNNLGGIATIKSYTAEQYEVGRIDQHSLAYRAANEAAIKFSAAFIPLIRMAVLAGFIAILVWGGFLVIGGSLNPGLYSSMVYMTQRLLWPLTRLGQTLDLYQRAMASTTRIMDLLDTDYDIRSGDIQLPDMQGAVHFEDVTFAYSDGTTVLKNINLIVPAGKTAALVGPTGSGKSTVIKLLLRFYDATAGRITVDGVDVRALDLHHLRGGIGLVSQDTYLFHGTADENIRYGSFDATPAHVVNAAKIGEAHDFISQLPNGYETVVGERGQKLSGGQRQRISIARAVLKDPPILVLDEATSAVDNETEAAIQRSMETITVGRTTIIIAHRLSTVRNADTIYVVDDGRIVEQGTHDDLVRLNGLYADLWRIQTGERRA